MTGEFPGTLPAPLPLHRGESLTGYLVRVAGSQGYDRATWITRAVGAPSRSSALWDDAVLGRLTAFLALEPGALRHHTHVPVPGGHNFFGDVVPAHALEAMGRKACAACLREKGFQDGLFDLRAVSVCPDHGTRLRTACWSCGTALRTRDGSLVRCGGCDADLTLAVDEPVPETEMAGVRALAARRRLAGCVGEAALAHLDLGQYAELILGLSNYRERRSQSTEFLAPPLSQRADVHRWLSEGAAIASRWPSGFHHLLDEVVEENRRLRALANDLGFGMHHDFGRLAVYLSQADREPWLTVREAFFEYLTERWDGVYVARDRAFVPESVVSRMRYMTLMELRRATGLRHQKLTTLLDAGLMSAEPIGPWHGAPLKILRADIARISPDGRFPIGIMEAGKVLGVNFKKMPSIVADGALPALAGPSVDGSKVYVIKPADLDAVLTDIRSHVTGRAPAGRLLSFSDTVRRATDRSVPVGRLVAAMRDGRVAPVLERPDGVGLARFVFERCDATRAIDALDLDLNEAALGLRQAAVTEALGQWPDTTTWLQDHGFLKCAMAATIAYRRTERAEIQRFVRRWITMQEFASAHGISVALSRVMLETAGVPRLTKSTAARCIDHYYDRAVAASMDFESVGADIRATKAEWKRETVLRNRAIFTERRRVRNRLLKAAVSS